MVQPLTRDTFAAFTNMATADALGPMIERAERREALDRQARRAAVAEDHLDALSWDDYIGQPKVKAELLIRIHSALARQAPMPHVLLLTGPGQGKTTVARLIARELDRPFLALTHPPLNARDLADKLYGFEEGVVLLDEIHQYNGKLEHAVMNLTEGGELETDHGTYSFPGLTVVAATTEKHKVFRALRDRFGVIPRFVDYTDQELVDILLGMVSRCDVIIGEPGTHPDLEDIDILGPAAAGSPRRARHLAEAVRDLSVTGQPCDANSVLAMTGVSLDGLNEDDLDYLHHLSRSPGGRAGLPTLATLTGQPTDELRLIESILAKRGLITFSPAGRQITNAGRRRIS